MQPVSWGHLAERVYSVYQEGRGETPEEKERDRSDNLPATTEKEK